jgi:acylphosphatase
MRVHVVVRGRVQGVGFRWFVKEVARGLDLAGWVKNRADGGVEVVAEGSEGSVRSLMQQLRNGPQGADVREVQELPSDTAAVPKPFAIAR